MWIPSFVVPLLTRCCVLPLAILVAGSVAACSTADNTPPVASVSVAPAQARVPIGSPIELTYRFELTGSPVTESYMVFVHLVNADGQMIGNDDHQPPVPTTEWRPGVPVEYSRTWFLPALLHPGDATLEVGLYRDGERLPLSAARAPRSAGSRSYPVADLQVAPESENIFLVYPTGWHGEDFGSAGVPSSKWTQQAATITFRHPRRDVSLLLQYSGRPGAFGDTPQQVTLLGADRQPITTFAVDSGEVMLRRIPVSSAQMGTGEMAELRIDVDRTFVPAELGTGETDSRALGIRVYQVFVEPR